MLVFVYIESCDFIGIIIAHVLILYIKQVVNPPEMIFHQLVELNLSTCAQGWWDLLIHMLQNSPKLQILNLVNVKVCCSLFCVFFFLVTMFLSMIMTMLFLIGLL